MAHEAMTNAESFNQVPEELLEWESKEVFQHLALQGKDCYAYSAGPADQLVWNLWLEGVRFQFVGKSSRGRTLLERI